MKERRMNASDLIEKSFPSFFFFCLSMNFASNLHECFVILSYLLNINITASIDVGFHSGITIADRDDTG